MSAIFMKLFNVRISLRWVSASVLASLSSMTLAQPVGLLYDPEPPPDSAYVRAVHASRNGDIDMVVDGRVRARKLGPGEASEYMVLNAGKHVVAVHPAGKSAPLSSVTLEVVRGRATTVAFTALKGDAAPVIFDDKTNSNRLKALLAVYHLDPKIGPVDIFTADGSTKVFTGLRYGVSESIQVNPISIDLIAVKMGDKAPLTTTTLAMSQGGAYSVLLLPHVGGKLTSRIIQNKNERFTGK